MAFSNNESRSSRKWADLEIDSEAGLSYLLPTLESKFCPKDIINP